MKIWKDTCPDKEEKLFPALLWYVKIDHSEKKRWIVIKSDEDDWLKGCFFISCV